MSIWIDLAGLIFGCGGIVLAGASLLTEHKDSPLAHRYTIGALGILCFTVALDSVASIRSVYGHDEPSMVAVAFAIVVDLNWMYRLFGMRSTINQVTKQ